MCLFCRFCSIAVLTGNRWVAQEKSCIGKECCLGAPPQISFKERAPVPAREEGHLILKIKKKSKKIPIRYTESGLGG